MIGDECYGFKFLTTYDLDVEGNYKFFMHQRVGGDKRFIFTLADSTGEQLGELNISKDSETCRFDMGDVYVSTEMMFRFFNEATLLAANHGSLESYYLECVPE